MLQTSAAHARPAGRKAGRRLPPAGPAPGAKIGKAPCVSGGGGGRRAGEDRLQWMRTRLGVLLHTINACHANTEWTEIPGTTNGAKTERTMGVSTQAPAFF